MKKINKRGMILSWIVNILLLGMIFWFVDYNGPHRYLAFSFALFALVTTLIFYRRRAKAPA